MSPSVSYAPNWRPGCWLEGETPAEPLLTCYSGMVSDPLGISLRPCPVPSFPTPFPAPSRLLCAGKSSRLQHPPSFLLVPNRRPEGKKRLEAEGRWSSWRLEASGPTATKDNARQHSLGVLGGFHGLELITFFSLSHVEQTLGLPASL